MPTRPTWNALPAPAKHWVAAQLGSDITAVEPAGGGLTNGIAAVLSAGSGRRAFLKAVAADQPTAGLYERERHAAAALPASAPAPRLLGHTAADDWVLLLFDVAGSRHANLAPGSPDLPVVLATLATLRETLTPCPWEAAPDARTDLGDLHGWRVLGDADELNPWAQRHLDRLIESEVHVLEAIGGSTLLHTDLRADNLLIDGQGAAQVVDWSWAVQGADWLEPAFLLPQLILAGHHPGAAQNLLQALPAWQNAEPRTLTAFAIALTGLWERGARNPNSPEDLRSYRARAAVAGCSWIQHRTGWL
jgi:hypothetical protein